MTQEKTKLQEFEVHTSKKEFRVYIPDGNGGEETICFVKNETDQSEKFAILFADSINTFNKCGKTPSELLAENEILTQALNDIWTKCRMAGNEKSRITEISVIVSSVTVKIG